MSFSRQVRELITPGAYQGYRPSEGSALRHSALLTGAGQGNAEAEEEDDEDEDNNEVFATSGL